MHFKITSTQNPKVKSLLALQKPRERKKQCLFIIEGVKEVQMALQTDYTIGNIFFCDELISQEKIEKLFKSVNLLIPVSKDVFNKLAVREDSGGVLAVAEMKTHSLDKISLKENSLILVLESVEKPGNLGAILRTADAAGIDAVISCDPQTDFYNPNVIRSSVGAVFTNQLASDSSAKTIDWLKKNKIAIFCTHLKGARPYHQADYTKPSAVVMGTESIGLSDQWVKAANETIIIPMAGAIDSMNVSASAAVVVFEARRQRGFM